MTWQPTTKPGNRTGRLTVTGKSRFIRTHYYVETRCDCGREGHMVLVSNLNLGKTKSCGCLKRELARQQAPQAVACEGGCSLSKTALYRHFDADGVLLYVGISLSAVQRLEQHKRSAGWFGDIARIDVEWWPFRRLAEQAETSAIWNERPVWNVVRPLAEPPPAPLWNERMRSWDLDSRIPL